MFEIHARFCTEYQLFLHTVSALPVLSLPIGRRAIMLPHYKFSCKFVWFHCLHSHSLHEYFQSVVPWFHWLTLYISSYTTKMIYNRSIDQAVGKFINYVVYPVIVYCFHLQISHSTTFQLSFWCPRHHVIPKSNHVNHNITFTARHMIFKAKIYTISSHTHQLQFIKLHHFKLEIFKSI